ncbi:SpoIIE family protein phosphatase [Streptomyces sp. ACA25]|uniref:SpoIIE family protein phosphatase n=1 Tax=Streptomyces sp. ACA25 TaxID=3022596 RepID=UPI00230815E1|nr:SpoIIE family protein phosphatase [Streptomyces sp. ACA25]MDB1088544.1 SpoIIE family protein phosphatase [Streptomyces sp. ACA25]
MDSGEAARDGLSLALLDSAPVAMAVTWGSNHVLAYRNILYGRILPGPLPGSPIAEGFTGQVREDAEKWFGHVYRTGETVLLKGYPIAATTPGEGPEDRSFDFRLTPINAESRGRGVLVVGVEVTEQVLSEERNRALSEERRRILHRYESLLSTAEQKMWVTDPEGRVIERSPAWEKETGQTWEEARGHGWLNTAHPADRGPLAEAWLEAVRNTPDLFEYGYRLRRRDGVYRHSLVRAVPIREAGEVVEWVVVYTDVESKWIHDRRTELLARAATVVTDSQDVLEACDSLSWVIVPALADACAIYLLPNYPSTATPGRPVSVDRVANAVRAGLPPGLAPRREERFTADSAFAQVMRDRRPIFASFHPDDLTEEETPPGTLDWLRESEAHSAAILPVVVDGVVAAIVTAVVCGERDPISPADITLMRELVEHAPLAHALQLYRTQRLALALQHSLLTDPPQFEDLEIEARYLASPTAAEVGGDWYDSFVLPDGHLVVAIGDVAGHDLEAAVTMSKMRNMLRGLAADRLEPPGDILRRLDGATQLLDPEEPTATCVLGRLERAVGGGWQFYYSIAGHPPPLLVSPEGEARFLEEAHNPLIGLGLSDFRVDAIEPLPAGSTLMLYTDGLVERPGEHLDDGLDRLRRHAAEVVEMPLALFCDDLLSEPAGIGRDDIAIIAVRLPPAEAGPGPAAPGPG